MLLDIVILPPRKLRERLGKLIRKAVGSRPRVFVVDNKNAIPHLSLFHVRTSKKRAAELEQKVQSLAKKYEATKIRSLGTEIYEGVTVGYKLSKNRILRRMNQNIVRECHGIRTGMMPWTLQRTPTRREMHKRRTYGTQWNINDGFRPHFTVARLQSADDAKHVSKKLKAHKFEFVGDTVAICKVNFWHQVTAIVKKFKLGK